MVNEHETRQKMNNANQLNLHINLTKNRTGYEDITELSKQRTKIN